MRCASGAARLCAASRRAALFTRYDSGPPYPPTMPALPARPARQPRCYFITLSADADIFLHVCHFHPICLFARCLLMSSAFDMFILPALIPAAILSLRGACVARKMRWMSLRPHAATPPSLAHDKPRSAIRHAAAQQDARSRQAQPRHAATRHAHARVYYDSVI